MTEALNVRALLFGPSETPPRQLGPDIVKAGTQLPRRQATYLGRLLVPSVLELLHDWLQFDLGDHLLDAWERWEEARQQLVQSRLHPADPTHVPIAGWQTSWSTRPALDVFVNDQLFVRFELQAGVDLHVKEVELRLQAGRLVGISTGSWSATTTLACNEQQVLERTVSGRALPGVTFGRSRQRRQPLPPAAAWPPPTLKAS